MVRLHCCHIVRTSKLLSMFEVLHLLSPLNAAYSVSCSMNQKSIFLKEFCVKASPNTLCFQKLYTMMQLMTKSRHHQLMMSQNGTAYTFQSITKKQNKVGILSAKNQVINVVKFQRFYPIKLLDNLSMQLIYSFAKYK